MTIWSVFQNPVTYAEYLKCTAAAKCSIVVTFDSYFLNNGERSMDCSLYKLLLGTLQLTHKFQSVVGLATGKTTPFHWCSNFSNPFQIS